MFDRLFLEHPRSIGMSWGEHGRGAFSIGLTMFLGGIACMIHAAIPGLFRDTASKVLERMHNATRKRAALNFPDFEI